MPKQPVWCVILLAALLPSLASACTTPVFRYALENWVPSRYEIFVLHEGPLSREQEELVTRVQSEETALNGRVVVQDLRTTSAATAGMWQKYAGGQKPCLIVRFPDETREIPAWVAPLNRESVNRLMTSPARKAVVKKLTEGDSAVWVVLRGSDEKANAKAIELVRGELARLAGEIQLPEQDPAFPLRSTIPLKLRFGVVEVAREDSQEAFFVQTLLGCDTDLQKVTAPVVFPVIGRGRILAALHGKQLTAAQLERWASFLCGPCSCRVKELNPGLDTLLDADWETLLDLTDVAPKEAIAQTIAVPPGEPVAVEAPVQSESSLLWLWCVLGGSGLVALASGLWRLRGHE